MQASSSSPSARRSKRSSITSTSASAQQSDPHGIEKEQQNETNIDDMDPAALLESLANFEVPPPNNDVPVPTSSNENKSFERLLQAAATAGGQELQHNEAKKQNQANKKNSPDSQKTEKAGKRKRSDEVVKIAPRPGKRQKQLESEYEAQAARERDIWGGYEDDEDFDAGYEPSISKADARSMGVHSAAALFRKPSEKSRKYTRPPMAKLFTSLQITAEEFIHLQAAAKDFMLDENHPERYDTVGSKERGDNDMVKLKLFGCVTTFLESGWGERLWGKGATEPEKQTLRWPESDKRIISLITPLLRRMVTNERQRRYATDQRNKKSREKQQALNQHNSPPQQLPELDSKLEEYNTKVAPHLPSELLDSPADVPLGPVVEDSGPRYHLNIVQGSRRQKSKLVVTPDDCPGYSSLVQHIHNMLEGEDKAIKSIKVLGPHGQVPIENEDIWRDVLETVHAEEFMDDKVMVIVQVEKKS